MRILYFHQHFSTPRGSTGIRSYQMARRLVERGHQVTMVCGSYLGGHTGLQGTFRSGSRRGTVDGIDVIELDLAYSNSDGFIKRSAIFAKFAVQSVRLALSEPCDVIFATTTPLTAGIPGIVARWLKGRRFVFEVRDLWPELPRAMGVISNPVVLWALGALEWASYRSAHRLIGLSPGIVDGIARRGVARESIASIPNGCDIEIFAEPPPPWRPDLIQPSDLLAVFAGTHGMANGLDKVLDAAAELKRRGRQDIKLLLIGQGKLKPALKARASSEGLENVVFHDAVDKQRLASLMSATDIGMQILANVPAFYFGTSPNKFFDYIAAGRPVLINYPGWLAELVTERRCGYVVAPDDASAFADALEHAASHREGLLKMGDHAASLARERFDRRKMADEWVDWVVGAAC